MRAGMAVAGVAAASGLLCAAARKAGRAKSAATRKKELRTREVWSFIFRPRCRFESESVNRIRPEGARDLERGITSKNGFEDWGMDRKWFTLKRDNRST